MHIIINNSSMVPIYEQIIDQIKSAIIRGELQPDTVLPSVRSLSKELKISALTVKKAYDNLEEEGFTVTVHGKGTYVAATNKNLMREEQLKEVEHDLEQAIMKGRRCGLNDEEIRNLFEMIMEENQSFAEKLQRFFAGLFYGSTAWDDYRTYWKKWFREIHHI